MKPGALAGLRILIVEDEPLVGMLEEDLLREEGCEVVGPATNVRQALALVAAERLDGAVLDVNLGAEQVFPVADALALAGVPFIFVTGYGQHGVTGVHIGRPMLQKPFKPTTFASAIAEALQPA